MKVTVVEGEKIFTLQVTESLTLTSFKLLCSVETRIPNEEVILKYAGREMTENDKTLGEYGLTDDSLVELEKRTVIYEEHFDPPTPSVPSAPPIPTARGGHSTLGGHSSHDVHPTHQQELDEVVELYPETLVRVSMLMIKCQVNGKDVVALVDTGAQASIMSLACAERCGIVNMIDRRFRGVAQGVGLVMATGRIHLCQLKIGVDFLALSLLVMPIHAPDMIFGLDMMKRYQCKIDLKKGVMIISANGREVNFLRENEIPTGYK